jgi:hypothetical protein
VRTAYFVTYFVIYYTLGGMTSALACLEAHEKDRMVV